MRFAQPFWLLLLLLLPILLVLFFWSLKQKKKELERFFNLSFPYLKKDMMEKGGREKISFIITLAGILFLILALAMPQIGSKMEAIKRVGADVIFLIDASPSMNAKDVQPTRFKRAKEEVIAFLEELEGDRAGLVVFAHSPVLISPLTTDYRALKEFLDTVETDIFHEGGTSLERAVSFCISIFRQAKEGARVIILISDGEDSGSDIESAAQAALQNGIKIYTIGAGSKDGAPIPVFTDDGLFVSHMEEPSGRKILTRLEESTLMKVSSLTGGRYYNINNGRVTKGIISDLRKIKRAELEAKVSEVYIDRFQYFLLTAFCLIFIGKYIKPQD